MRKWENVKSEIEKSFTKEDLKEIDFEMQIIEATIEARKKKKISQQELSKLTGITQSSIARVESGTHSPSMNTLIRMLTPMGYTLKVVPIKKINKFKNH